MTQDPVFTVFVVIIALAFVAQAGVMYAIYRSMQVSRREFEAVRAELKQRLEPLAQSMTDMMTNCREPVLSMVTNLNEISRIMRERTNQVDAVVADLADRSRLQIIRIDQMVTEMVQRAQNTADVVERNVLAPVQEFSAFIKGVRTGFEFLFGRRRKASVSEVPQDEQMFI